MNIILNFNEISKTDLPLVGGKGANLGEMSRGGFPVPPGFCVSTAGFDSFLKVNNLQDKIFPLLDGLKAEDTQKVKTIGETIRNLINSSEIPFEIEKSVKNALNQSGIGNYYAIRSSATAEDLPDASFAGQQDTYLNITGLNDILIKIKSCWASLYTDRAITYRIQNAFDHSQIKLSVVVQKMITPDVSGILFTVDPISENRKIMTIDASYGLGEALVSGLVSSDLYKISKTNLTIISKSIGEKKIAIQNNPDGGTYQENLSESMQKSQALTDDQIISLSKLGYDIETYYGKPQDIEWCIEKNQIYIVQSRPITSLYPDLEPKTTQDELHVYISFGHGQVMTDAFKPLGISMIHYLAPFSKSNQEILRTNFIKEAGGRIYIDVSNALRIKTFRKRKTFSYIDELIFEALEEVTTRQDFNTHFRLKTFLTLLYHGFTFAIPKIFKLLWVVFLANPLGRSNKILYDINRRISQYRKHIHKLSPGISRLISLKKILTNHLLKVAKYLPYILSSMLVQKKIEKLLSGKGLDEEINAITHGLRGNITTEMDLMVGDLADIIMSHPDLYHYLKVHPLLNVLSSIKNVNGGSVFLKKYDEFITIYGSRGNSEIDITRPRWSEDPKMLMNMILSMCNGKEINSHRKHYEKMVLQGDKAEEKIISSSKDLFKNPIKRWMVKRFVNIYRNNFSAREHPKYYIMELFKLVKETLLDEAIFMKEQDLIDEVKDIYYLHLDEIIQILKGYNQRNLIKKRKLDYNRYVKMSPPRVLTSDGEKIIATHKSKNIPQGAMIGSPASTGIIEGIAKVIIDPAKESLNSGEILVAPFTDPGWTPLFIHASGLIMEVGGLMTHGSVVAREYGIPAVVCVPDATKLIKSGQRVRVNGNIGYVEILDGGEK